VGVTDIGPFAESAHQSMGIEVKQGTGEMRGYCSCGWHTDYVRSTSANVDAIDEACMEHNDDVVSGGYVGKLLDGLNALVEGW
jgi:hypothetical protein